MWQLQGWQIGEGQPRLAPWVRLGRMAGAFWCGGPRMSMDRMGLQAL